MAEAIVLAVLVVAVSLLWVRTNPEGAERAAGGIDKLRTVAAAIGFFAFVYVFMTTGGAVYTGISILLLAVGTIYVAVKRPDKEIT